MITELQEVSYFLLFVTGVQHSNLTVINAY